MEIIEKEKEACMLIIDYCGKSLEKRYFPLFILLLRATELKNDADILQLFNQLGEIYSRITRLNNILSSNKHYLEKYLDRIATISQNIFIMLNKLNTLTFTLLSESDANSNYEKIKNLKFEEKQKFLQQVKDVSTWISDNSIDDQLDALLKDISKVILYHMSLFLIPVSSGIIAASLILTKSVELLSIGFILPTSFAVLSLFAIIVFFIFKNYSKLPNKIEQHEENVK
ncbi:MAG: hypothetical protein LBJ93_01060 [Clostridiales bacterium]|nr:hypothetical protein [Clostridiales bacterium]